MTNARTSHREGEESSHPGPSPLFVFLGALALVICCALPFLIIAAGGLSLSLLFGGDAFLVTVLAIVVVVLLVVVGTAMRSKNRNKSPQQAKPDGDACCG